MKLIDALQLHYPDSSKRTLRQWIKWGRVSIDGKSADKPDQEISDTQKLNLAQKERSIHGIPIIYQDQWMVVIDKPAGLLSVPAEKNPSSALRILKEQLPSLLPVHRIDEGTSGVLIFAKGRQSEVSFKIMFEKHEIEREYLAIVDGFFSKEQGTWKHFLREKENYDVEIVSAEEGKPAITHFSVIRRSKKYSYLKLRLETGRKHQIRVQCAEAGHPIVGDHRYGSLIKNRLCLHAHFLSFIHPFTGKPMQFYAPIPKRLEALGLKIES